MKVQKHIQFDERFSRINGRQKDKNSTFLYGVISTGIFCLPHCPSKVPNPENVVYFKDASQALNQGFRSCKRCKPNLSPNLTVEDEHEKILQLAKKEIMNNSCKKVGELAKILNISERQLHRIIKAKTGDGVLAFIKSQS